MIILDENFPDSQRQIVRGWRISCKQIAFEVGREGIKDDEIIPLLHSLTKPTLYYTGRRFLQTTFAPSTLLPDLS